MALMTWRRHGDGRTIAPGAVVAPDERLSWPRTIGIGMQHVVAMFGATFLVPLLTGLPPATTLFFSAIGTALFLLITRGRLPSYLGSSFAFIAPIGAAAGTYGMSSALGGVVVTGALLAVVGLVVHVAGARWIDVVMPPVVTGTIVALIGFNLAPAAWGTCQQSVVDGEIVESCTSGFRAAPVTATITLLAIVLVTVLFRGILGRLSILVGVVIGYVVATIRGEVDFTAVSEAAWIGLPQFTTPTFTPAVLGLFVPVVLVLVAENVGHVKSVSAMTGTNLDGVTGRALMADGLSTVLAGSGGGSGTTTYAENIGVMAATRVYSTAAYWVAAATALLLSLSPKFGALIATIPAGVLGGAATVLYGMIGVLGARIWVQNKVNFADPVNLTTAAIALIIGIANFTWTAGDLRFEGIALGTAAAIGIYHLMRAIARWRGTSVAEPASPASVPAAD
ncbi:uracil-xanthine permease [Beutenbergia cavernae DSM 12333]|uniref:Uracil-xanthine permease n=1 Tax=Beutenbergia cavernae (strain ATCC BAA-8 / DSM 12333 / CCUG 43141 / JCM 11478 / NBRC 16432 / NCIMB 13614 / HKI 0122) TaxID=471853 RepID=C5BW81_BEUC1|nr:solute carrier family 23 protein [Beutenbergia cavernae]ACQ78539.1 uracil-xanthine permease [Beutenbergia cavernae DSM 12333]